MSRLVSALVSVLIVSSGAQAASLTLGCTGTLTTTHLPKDGVAPEPEKENVSDYSVVVDLDRRAVFAFWFEACPGLLNCLHSALPITKTDANGVYFEAKRKEFGSEKITGGVDRITGYVNADDTTTYSNGSSMNLNWDLHCKPTRPLF
jgi:hypothetical protein